MDNNNSSNTRRQFLRYLGISGAVPLYRSPLALLMESIVMGAQQSTAFAATTGTTPRRYLHILQEGAPPRWTLDLFLTPYSNAGFVSSKMLGTAYNFSSSGASVRYDTTVKSGLIVPQMWNYNVPAASGGTRPIAGLLPNMLQLRGIEIGNPDHGAAQAMQFMPIGAVQSMSSLSADTSTDPIAAVNVSVSQFQFVSLKSKSAISVGNGGNMLATLLAPFTASRAGTFLTNKNKLGAALDTAVNAINTASQTQRSGVDSISFSNQAAKDLMSKGFGDLTASWNTLVAKYSSLIKRSLDTTQSLAGINDATIVSDGTGFFGLNGVPVKDADLRKMITTSTGIYNTAEHFAMAEYILLNNLSASIAISPGYLYNVSANGGNTGLGADEHTTGGAISTILNTYVNIANSACLLELTDRLKAAGIFEDTVIVMGGEFGRCARTDAAGSDHGYLGSSSVIYSGAITSPLVLGNIYNSKTQGGGDYGTWGMGAPVAQLGRPLSVSDWACTIAYLLKVSPPTTASTSLVVSSAGGGIAPLIEKARQI